MSGQNRSREAHDVIMAFIAPLSESDTATLPEMRLACQRTATFSARYKQLSALIESLNLPDQDELLWRVADVALSASLVGSLAPVLPSGRKYVDGLRAASMRYVREQKVAPRMQVSMNAICEEAKDLSIALADSREFAERVRPGVLRRLGSKKYPSVTTIRNHVAKLRKAKA